MRELSASAKAGNNSPRPAEPNRPPRMAGSSGLFSWARRFQLTCARGGASARVKSRTGHAAGPLDGALNSRGRMHGEGRLPCAPSLRRHSPAGPSWARAWPARAPPGFFAGRRRNGARWSWSGAPTAEASGGRGGGGGRVRPSAAGNKQRRQQQMERRSKPTAHGFSAAVPHPRRRDFELGGRGDERGPGLHNRLQRLRHLLGVVHARAPRHGAVQGGAPRGRAAAAGVTVHCQWPHCRRSPTQ